MATQAVLGAGTLFKIGNGASPEVFTTVGEGRNIGAFGQQNDLIEVTHFQSTAREYIYGLADGMEFTFTMNYLPSDAAQVAALAAQAARTTKNFQYVIPTSPTHTFTFSGLVRAWQLEANTPNSPVQLSATIKISGAISG